jgi:hypothetical protein
LRQDQPRLGRLGTQQMNDVRAHATATQRLPIQAHLLAS